MPAAKKFLKSRLIEPEANEEWAFHVFTPALLYRAANPSSDLPVMALRSPKSGFHLMRLFHQIDCLGPSQLRPLFGSPLPGTGGRGLAILFTSSPMRVWWTVAKAKRELPAEVYCPDDRDPKVILEDVFMTYPGCRVVQPPLPLPAS
jgi:hypothetical protein